MKARDYRLVVDGKYNRRAIMQRAWAYMKKNKAFKWYSFAKALKDAWVDAGGCKHAITDWTFLCYDRV